MRSKQQKRLIFFLNLLLKLDKIRTARWEKSTLSNGNDSPILTFIRVLSMKCWGLFHEKLHRNWLERKRREIRSWDSIVNYFQKFCYKEEQRKMQKLEGNMDEEFLWIVVLVVIKKWSAFNQSLSTRRWRKCLKIRLRI